MGLTIRMVTAGRTSGPLIAALLALSGLCPCWSAPPADLNVPAHECGGESESPDEPARVDCETSCSGASVVATKQRVDAPLTHHWDSAHYPEQATALAPALAESCLPAAASPPSPQRPIYIRHSVLTL